MIRKAVLLSRELRAPFLAVSAAPVLVGTSLAFRQTGGWDWGLFGCALGGVLLLHAGANVINDYFDHLSGADAANAEFVSPYSGGSRLIQDGLLAPREVLVLALACFAGGVAVAAYLAARVGAGVLAFGLAGLAAGFCYTCPGVNLAGRGLGEAVVGLAFGLLPVAGAHFVQTGRLAACTVLPGAVPSLLVAAILLINQFPDVNADRLAGKRNLVVRMGRRKAARVYAALMLSWPAPLAAAVAGGTLPPASLLALLPLGLAARASALAVTRYDDPAGLRPAHGMTILTALLTAVFMALTVVADRLLRRGGGA
jgi:1,4-dihydroxy-2-naphthoate octaprenyltransferase